MPGYAQPVDIYASDVYNITEEDVFVRQGPGTDQEIVGLLSDPATFTLEGTEIAADGSTWYKLTVNGITGYVCSDFAAPLPEEQASEESSEEDTENDPAEEPETMEEPSEETSEETTEEQPSEETSGELSQQFEEYDEEFLASLFAPGDQPEWSGYVQSEEEFEAQLSQFPESYHAGLRAVHAAYPNYTFRADYTGMDFQTLVDAEDYKKVSAASSDSYKAMYDSSFGYYENYNWETGEWYNSEGAFTLASSEIIEYYIDPRNFLNPNDIYMFLRQSWSSDVSEDDLRSFLEGTFLAQGYVPNRNDADDLRLEGDYAKVILEASRLTGLSPFVMATTIFSEQGYAGTSELISGYYEADDGTLYVSLYNFFNYGATGSDRDNVVQNGLERAKREGWISRYQAIIGGAYLYADGYVNNNQDTYYYKNFNVLNGWGSLGHQYATAISNAYISGSITRGVYADSTYAALEFRIPVYENMPSEPSDKPAASDEVNNYYFTDMQATGLVPEFSMANRDYTMTVTGDTTLRISVPQWAEYEGYDAYALTYGDNLIVLNVRSQTGYVRSYRITVTSSGDYTLYVDASEGSRLSMTEEDDSQSSDGNENWGDANGDGKVSSLDYIAIRQHIMQTAVIADPLRLAAADTNGDGKVSSLDYIAVKNYIMSR